MLAKKNRVQKEKFPAILKGGAFFHSPNFTLRSLPSPVKGENRFSAVVSKKVASLAVKRNYLRRKVYGILEKNIGAVSRPHTTLIFLKNDLSSLSTQDIIVEIETLLKKAHIV